jgi:hypothetical protein
LSGHGVITASQARAAAQAAGATWLRLVTDEVSGTVTDIGRTQYRPSAAIADLVRAKHPRCVFPTCSRPAAACDLDHCQPFDRTGAGQGGTTSVANLAPVCRFHHGAKTHGGWSWTPEPDTTTNTAIATTAATTDQAWTSPTGKRYINVDEPILTM